MNRDFIVVSRHKDEGGQFTKFIYAKSIEAVSGEAFLKKNNIFPGSICYAFDDRQVYVLNLSNEWRLM